jgi:hypothetical protein
LPAYDKNLFDPPAPVAKVTLHHPDSGESATDIPMPIDSGADATLLPKSAVARLGITGTGERYQLIGFDGTPGESEIVRADLVFLRRSFADSTS